MSRGISNSDYFDRRIRNLTNDQQREIAMQALGWLLHASGRDEIDLMLDVLLPIVKEGTS